MIVKTLIPTSFAGFCLFGIVDEVSFRLNLYDLNPVTKASNKDKLLASDEEAHLHP